jgi:lipopolysaccharide transport system ATP-binding protein
MEKQSSPTVFHVTHHKAGSQWVAEILKYCALDRFQRPDIDLSFFYNMPIKPEMVYLTVYVPKKDFDHITTARPLFSMPGMSYTLTHPSVYLENWRNFRVRKIPFRRFVVIRDLRDTLISLYFSWKISHAFHFPWQFKSRELLHRLSVEEGLAAWIGEGERSRYDGQLNPPFLEKHYKRINRENDNGITLFLQKLLDYIADIQLSWINDDAFLIRYEDLIADEVGGFEKIVDHCRIPVSRERLHEIIHYNRFEAVTGRHPGEEDVQAHQRKGISGDWRNYFSLSVKEKFKSRFGDVLIKTGYESDLNW